MKYFKKAYYQRKYESFLKRFFLEKHKWLLVKKDYEYATSKKLNWKTPKDINQKLLWLTRYWQNPLIITCADKFKVRDYIRDCGLEKLLVPLIGVYDSVEDIDFDNLPNQFVLKCNHGSGTNIICRDKSKIDFESIKLKLNGWLSNDYGGGY